MNLHKMYTAGFVFVLAVTLRGVSAAEVMLQDPPKEPGSQEPSQPSTEEQRKRTLKSLREQAQRAAEARKKEAQQKEAQKKEPQQKEAQQKETPQKEGQQKERQKVRVTPFGTLPASPESATEETKKKEAQQKKGQVTPFGQLPTSPQGGAPGTAAPTPPPQTPPAQTPPPQPAPVPVPVPAPAPPPVPAPPPPTAVQHPPMASDQVQLNFDNAELYDFVNQIADTLGITPIIIDPNVKGSVNIHSSAPLAKDDVFPLFNLILKTNNAALVKQGNIYQLVPISEALRKGLEIIDHQPLESPVKPDGPSPASKGTAPPGTPQPAQPPQNGGSSATAPNSSPTQTPATPASATAQAGAQPQAPKLSTHVIRAEFVSVKDLIEPLKLFMTEGGVIMPYERLNMLIVTDYADNIQKIMEIIHLLDDAFINPDLVELVGIKYNASADIVDDLRKIFGSGAKDSSTGIYFLSLDRINAILVMTNSKRALAEFKRWVEKLDSTAGRSVQTFVYTVENSTASNIMLILTALFGGEGGNGAGKTGTEGGAGTGGAGAVGAIGGSGGRGTSLAQQSPFGGGGGYGGGAYGGGGYGGGGYGGGGYGGMGGGGYGGMGGGGYGGMGGGGYGGMGGGGYGGFGGGYGGGAFGGGSQLGPRLNQQASMSSQVFRGGALSGLQENVRVVANDINNTLVIQSSTADYAYLLEIIKKLDVLPRQVIIDARIFEIDLTNELRFGIGGQLQKTSTDPKDVPRATTGSIGADGTLSAATFAFVGNSREILLQLEALRTKTKVRILEAPSVLALDGTLARIVVGGEVPYPAGGFFGSIGSTTSVQYRDTGISLIVMPRISGSGVVTLDIAQEVSAPGASVPVGDTSALSFNKSSVATTLAVKDGEMVAIAGLIRDSNTHTRSGVPFFSEIPIIGSLFGNTIRNTKRTELLMLISPHVIKTPERFSEMTQELKDSLRNVRTLVDEKQKERLEDVEDARKDRSRKEEKRKKPEERQKESQPPPAKNPKD